ncbi:amidohydrolase family protein [Amycolatopsis sp. PS_44_ISF1]|uniref:amidohydrolase family protein n=1 Tax=Amycolatopsis sp. PS_44_ISF1 TaxID=2974917 RepID=UPI0028DD4803|nr:amidohydrolase family protein [Amycolatopsis sp. PS_44_ISF1]MDT8914439.1 amidohydrolase [Amycolatopsis sp. PS_44_ISF1]
MINPLSGPDRVDFHHHVFPGGAQATLLRRKLVDATGWEFPGGAPRWTPEASLAFMDGHGIRTAVLSLPNDLEHDLAPEQRQSFAREVNDLAHQAVLDHPGRFGFFAHLPCPTDVDAALAELRYALDELGADGVTLTNVYGTGEDALSIGDEVFEPLWAELDRRRALVFLHGEQTQGRNRRPNRFLPTPVSEVPNETYKGAADLVTRGRKRRYPHARIILSHSGGSTPFLAARVAVLSPHLGCELSPDEILEDFRTFYFETALSGFTTNLTALEDFVPPEQILFGTDFPAASPEMTGWYTKNVDSYFAGRPELHARIMHGNAETLLPRLSRSTP